MKEKFIKFIKTPIVMSILLFILGAILLTNPSNIVAIVTYGFGGVFLFLGFVRLANYLGDKKKGVANNKDLTYAIVLILIGIIVIVCTSIIELILRILMGGFILYNGIIRMTNAFNIKKSENSIWKGNLIISIVMISVGLYVILKSNLVFSMIGLFIMIYSALEIVLSVMTYNSQNIIIKK